MRTVLLSCLCLVAWIPIAGAATGPAAPACAAGGKWTQPAAPLKIYGNTWFVGTCGLSSILITSPQGHVLIDGGVEADAPLIEASIRRLGFRFKDVRYILNSHEHYDHVGGIARLQRDSGATVLARAPAAAALERGHGDRGDPQFLIARAFPPAAHVRRVKDGETIRLGPIALTAIATPGHTPGSTSWTWRSCADVLCLQVVYADSLTAVSDDAYRYSGPGALGPAFARSIERVASLPCDILLTPHPDASAMWSRLGANAAEPLVDPAACRRYAAAARKGLEARLERERGAR